MTVILEPAPSLIKKQKPSYLPFTHILDDSFYMGVRNELTMQKLKDLALFASSLKEPKIFGIYDGEDEYKNVLDLMLRSTEETRHRGIFFYRKILPLLKFKNSLLDIGPGDGQITSWVGNKFLKVTAVDINKEIIVSLNTNKKILRNKIQLNKTHGSIFNSVLSKNAYDLSLLSHVLYYIEKSSWVKAIERVYSATTNNGIVVIALSGDKNGKADLIKHFNGEPLYIDDLALDCATNFGFENVEMYSSKEVIITKTLAAMLHIAGFFLCDANTTAKKNDLIAYIIANNLKENGLYEMSTQQNFIVLHKK